MFTRILRASAINNKYKLHPVKVVCNYPFQIIHHESNTKQNDHSGRRGYKNFANKPEKPPLFTKIWYSFIITTFVLCLIDYKW